MRGGNGRMSVPWWMRAACGAVAVTAHLVRATGNIGFRVEFLDANYNFAVRS
ncbi:hypothetical protein ACFQ6E_11890 [Streptomyces sp. NPDC056462]|uniref:hypothetical protein n=1 Tax=Streptomyces sp. NPDC056462 TaxID=3345826 RepID=UPI0036A4BE53